MGKQLGYGEKCIDQSNKRVARPMLSVQEGCIPGSLLFGCTGKPVAVQYNPTKTCKDNLACLCEEGACKCGPDPRYNNPSLEGLTPVQG